MALWYALTQYKWMWEGNCLHSSTKSGQEKEKRVSNSSIPVWQSVITTAIQKYVCIVTFVLQNIF